MNVTNEEIINSLKEKLESTISDSVNTHKVICSILHSKKINYETVSPFDEDYFFKPESSIYDQVYLRIIQMIKTNEIFGRGKFDSFVHPLFSEIGLVEKVELSKSNLDEERLIHISESDDDEAFSKLSPVEMQWIINYKSKR